MAITTKPTQIVVTATIDINNDADVSDVAGEGGPGVAVGQALAGWMSTRDGVSETNIAVSINGGARFTPDAPES